SLGSYSVAGSLFSNTCGSGIGAKNPWEFTAEMSRDGDTLYLDQSDGADDSQIVFGTVEPTEGKKATLTSIVTTNVDRDANGAAGPCNLTLSTTYDISLNDASAPRSFVSTATFDYAAATGVSSTTNCTDQLASQGGKYATLPCTVVYSLTGKRK
ncbi:MAG TPA: hypothetical protein VEQ59_13015, partial [Polyangiaceae bacterium]|nr:hypothetical protein [Polyangiaceae bacterium]